MLPPPIKYRESGKTIDYKAITQEQIDFMKEAQLGNQESKYTADVLGLSEGALVRLRLRLFGKMTKDAKVSAILAGKVKKEKKQHPKTPEWTDDRDKVVKDAVDGKMTFRAASKILNVSVDTIGRRIVFFRDRRKKEIIKDIKKSITPVKLTVEQHIFLEQWARGVDDMQWMDLLSKTRLPVSQLIYHLEDKYLMGWTAFCAHKEAIIAASNKRDS